MTLTGKQIQREVERGRIHIDPFDPANLNPNSYNLRLSEHLKVYSGVAALDPTWPLLRCRSPFAAELQDGTELPFPVLDLARDNPTEDLFIGPKGLVLLPGVLYLAATVETAGADVFIPDIDGRSSSGRLGLVLHLTAGRGDLGFSGPAVPAQWTLEATVVHPLRVYAGAALIQIFFTTPSQDDDLGPLPRYQGKYAGQRGPKPSSLWKEFQRDQQPPGT